MREETIIRMEIEFPFFSRPRRAVAIKIESAQARCLLPLPSAREIPGDVWAQKEALEQRTERDRLRKQVIEMLVEKMDEMFAEEDSVNGYKKNELPPLEVTIAPRAEREGK